MSPKDVVALYYDAWISKRGDMSDVPLATDFKFRGPVADFNDAEGYRAMAREAGESSPRSPCGSSSPMATRSARSSTGRWRCRSPR